MAKESYKPLPWMKQSTAIKQSLEKIKEHMEVLQPGLLCRWDKVNEAMGGSFQFNRIIYICGASGSGKSYVLNMLRQDFASALNENYHRKFKILSFTLEMSAADEIIRQLSGSLKVSYSTLLSAYEKITQEYYKEIERTSATIDNDTVYYVEEAGNREQIEKTVEAFNNKYPEHQLIITIDHTLLMEYIDEKSEVELVSRLSRLALKLRKRYGAMIILLGQLNDKIEQADRLQNPQLHYPMKTDIHGAKAVYMAADDVIVIHAPEKLELKVYGSKAFPTKDLVAWHILKSRHAGNVGLIRMKQQFNQGNLIYPY